MSDSGIDRAVWRERLAALESPSVSAAVVVQCGQVWLEPEYTAFRNEVDRALMSAHLRRRADLTITRVILHNLPNAPEAPARAATVDRAFEEWHHRLSAATVLLSPGLATHRIHRLILRGDEVAAALPDMVEIHREGDWTDTRRVQAALHMVESEGATTHLTGYDVNFDGPFGDADPSVYM
ncbi:hypothetical protein SUDANB145_04607 [Streptomyces sp. enrichment culture]|uniref:hypothetical protein n=1 Tax=Streptomyces sp. enrichment culture TaxID=1795815 RepID=UPI003F577BE0